VVLGLQGGRTLRNDLHSNRSTLAEGRMVKECASEGCKSRLTKRRQYKGKDGLLVCSGVCTYCETYASTVKA